MSRLDIVLPELLYQWLWFYYVLNGIRPDRPTKSVVYAFDIMCPSFLFVNHDLILRPCIHLYASFHPLYDCLDSIQFIICIGMTRLYRLVQPLDTVQCSIPQHPHTLCTTSKLPPMTIYDGSPLCDETDQLQRWKYHFHEQFNNPAPPIDPVLVAEAASDISSSSFHH